MSYELPPPMDNLELGSIKMIYIDLDDLNKGMRECIDKTKQSHKDILDSEEILKTDKKSKDKSKLKELNRKNNNKEVKINIRRNESK